MDPLYVILFNSSLLIALTTIHLYWTLGGTVGLKYAFPNYKTSRNNTKSLNRINLFFITILLALMAFCFLVQTDIIFEVISENNMKWGNRIIAIIFFARSIGNFTYLGFTKTIKHSLFAKLDTYLYSPLCLFVAVSTFIITL